MRHFLFTVIAGWALFLSACSASPSNTAGVRIGALSTEAPPHQSLDFSEIPDRLAVYDEEISGLKKEIALLKDQNTNLQKRLDHVEQQSH